MNDSSINLPVPARGDPDRSRALNVLAQRRYRKASPPAHTCIT
jgi:hypothetical protein